MGKDPILDRRARTGVLSAKEASVFLTLFGLEVLVLEVITKKMQSTEVEEKMRSHMVEALSLEGGSVQNPQAGVGVRGSGFGVSGCCMRALQEGTKAVML